MTAQTFTPTSLKQHFTEHTWKKGARIFRDQCIKTCVLDDEVIRGLVFSESSRQKTYLSRLVFDTNCNALVCYCDCYLGSDCKHSAALAQQFIHKQFNQNHSASSEKVITKWLNHFKTQPSRYKPNSQQKSLLYFLKPNDHNPAEYVSLEIKSSRLKKSGGWSKSLSQEHHTHSLISRPYLTNDDVFIITELSRTNQYGSALRYFDLFDQVINTKRCFWYTNYDLDKPITLAPP